MSAPQLKPAPLILTLATTPALASFGGAPCREDFVCHFVTWGLLVGIAAGIPLSCGAFIALHLIFCNPQRSRLVQAFLAAVLGVVVYEVAAAGGALAGTYGKIPMTALLLVWGVLAVASVQYARSQPRQPDLARHDPAA
jgi:hypothetical protein